VHLLEFEAAIILFASGTSSGHVGSSPFVKESWRADGGSVHSSDTRFPVSEFGCSFMVHSGASPIIW